MPKCKLCEKEELQLSADGFCQSCVSEHALEQRPPPLRPRIPCVRCQSRSFVRCWRIRERAASGGDHATEYIAPLSVTYEHTSRVTVFRGRRVREVNVHDPVGILEAYVCRQCGYTEFYTREADKIPTSPEYATELFEAGGEPYR
jgi:hypothetical protein